MEPPLKLIKDWKYYTGMTFLVLSIIIPVFGLIVPKLGLHPGVTAVIMGSFMVGGPEILILIAVIFLGKDTVKYYKAKAFSYFKKEPIPHKSVSRFRYYFGVILIFGSVIPLYLNGYYPQILPKNSEAKYYLLLSMDLLFILGFFVAGGDFWEKFKRLFIWESNKQS